MEILTTIMPYLVAILAAATSYVVARINNKKAIERITTLEEFMASDDTVYYVTCPNCGSRICLNKVAIITAKRDPNVTIPPVEPKEDK